MNLATNKDNPMTETIPLVASDGHDLTAFLATPASPAKGAVVVVQEIFGVNSHIRNVCKRLAATGYTAIAPALFDRQERNFQSGYSANEVATARGFISTFDWDAALRDIAAARDAVAQVGPVSVMGFCLGGSLAWRSAAELSGFAAAVGYYGSAILKQADLTLSCPVMLHFGEEDAGIPIDAVRDIAARRGDVQIFTYPAGHGFNCDERAAFEPVSAQQAMARSLEHLAKYASR
jgi:carboxymethylenebutenolidase